MTTILDFYQQQAQQVQSQIPWLKTLQKDAIDEFARAGFPNRHHEEWKYTAVDSFLKHQFTINNSQASTGHHSDVPVVSKISIDNNHISGYESLRQQLPSGVIVQPLAQALIEHADKIKQLLGQSLQNEHAFHSLNLAALNTGIFIYIPKGVRLEAPLCISHWQDAEEKAHYLRHLIIAEAESECTLIEDFQGASDCSYFTNTITEAVVGHQAKITHYKIQRESKAAYHIGHIAVTQHAKSQFHSHSLSLGGKLVRSDVRIHLQQAEASCLLNGIYAPNQGQHVDHHTTIYHDVPSCQSEQDYKGILGSQSRAVFNGKVIVAKDAQHTQAKQQNKNLLLSTNAEIDTKPQLEIFADDVICTHGATVGQLDEDALFYLATRGISQAEASGFLIRAFAEDNLRRIPQDELRHWMIKLLDQQIG